MGDYTYVVNAGQGSISLLDPSDNEITDSFAIGSAPSFIAFSPIGARAYAVNNGSKLYPSLARGLPSLLSTNF